MLVFPFALATFALLGASASVQAARALVTAAPSTSQSSSFAGSVSPVGYWVTEDHAWTVRIATCANGFCGKIVGLGASTRPDVQRRDVQNPDASKRSATLCGLPVLGGFVPSDESGAWEDGWVYNPESGETYKSVMEIEGPATLKVRGYVLTPLFGRSETLTRVSGPARWCSNVPGVATGTSPTPSG
jgi:uncharacterized protein (DUF2147 family)